MSQSTQHPDYLAVLLAGAQAASQRDAWRARCEALQAELITQEVRHREVADGLRADLEDMDAQRRHWVRVAQGEMARRGEVREDTAEERDWYRRALAESRLEVKRLMENLVKTQAELEQVAMGSQRLADEWRRVTTNYKVVLKDLVETQAQRDRLRGVVNDLQQELADPATVGDLGCALRDADALLVAHGARSREWAESYGDLRAVLEKVQETGDQLLVERDQYRALAAAWETAAYDVRIHWPYGQRLPMSFQKAVELSDAVRKPPTSGARQEPAVWVAWQEDLDLGQALYAAWCVRFYDGADAVPGVARWSQQGRLSQESWAYVACCSSAGPDHARERAQALRAKYADNDVFQHAIR